MTTSRPGLYAIRGVPPGEAPDEISRAYHALLRRHHPDTGAFDEQSQHALSDATLQHVLAAYAVLHDPSRRADYDRGKQATSLGRGKSAGASLLKGRRELWAPCGHGSLSGRSMTRHKPR